MTSSLAWRLFPYPTYHGDSVTDGSLIPFPEICNRCKKMPCTTDETAPPLEIKTCPFGMHYARLDDHNLVLGVVATDLPTAVKLQHRRARTEGTGVRTRDLRTAMQAVSTADAKLLRNFARDRERLVAAAGASPELLAAVVQELREDLSRNLNQSHDFLQLAKLVRGYTVTLLEERLPGVNVIDAAERLPSEGSIYFATELMLAKFDAMMFLDEPNQAFGQEVTFDLHRMITKYFRIYRWQARQRELSIQTIGSSFGKVHYRSSAIGAIVQALLDNLVKYAPVGSGGDIYFTENASEICVQFRSLGPKILAAETSKIFLPGCRTEAARAFESSGLGFGLAAAKSVSNMLDLQLGVEQEPTEDPQHSGRFPTTFTVTFARSE